MALELWLQPIVLLSRICINWIKLAVKPDIYPTYVTFYSRGDFLFYQYSVPKGLSH
jgi:hypothetical protein